MDSSKYFYKLQGTCKVSNELLDFALSFKDWSRPAPWLTFLMVEAPSEIIRKDPLISLLLDQGWNKPYIFKSYPNSYYQFHIDKANRPVAINLLLKSADSTTVFLGDKIHENQFEVLRLNYEPDTLYLLNTTKHHAVLNFDQERYLLSICPPARYIKDWDPVVGRPINSKFHVTEDSKKVFGQIVEEFKMQNL